MGKLAKETLQKLGKKKRVSFEEIQKLYRDRSVKGVAFSCRKTRFYLKGIQFRNGSQISF